MSKPKQHTNYRTAKYLRKRDFTTVLLQTWNATKHIRQDASHLWDTLAYHPRHGILVTQNMTKTHLAAHRRKVEVADETAKWLRSNGKVFLVCWRKVGAKSQGARLLWEPRIEQAVLEKGKIVFVRIEDITKPVRGVPALSPKKKQGLATSEGKQEHVQARLQATLNPKAGEPEGSEGGVIPILGA
jgi:hypothetical protein